MELNCLPLLIDSFCLSKLDLFRALIFAILIILSSMRDEGYFCFKRNVFSFSSLTSSVLSFEIIIFNLLAKLYGMLFRVCFGWHDAYKRYCFESVSL